MHDLHRPQVKTVSDDTSLFPNSHYIPAVISLSPYDVNPYITILSGRQEPQTLSQMWCMVALREVNFTCCNHIWYVTSCHVVGKNHGQLFNESGQHSYNMTSRGHNDPCNA